MRRGIPALHAVDDSAVDVASLTPENTGGESGRLRLAFDGGDGEVFSVSIGTASCARSRLTRSEPRSRISLSVRSHPYDWVVACSCRHVDDAAALLPPRSCCSIFGTCKKLVLSLLQRTEVLSDPDEGTSVAIGYPPADDDTV